MCALRQLLFGTVKRNEYLHGSKRAGSNFCGPVIGSAVRKFCPFPVVPKLSFPLVQSSCSTQRPVFKPVQLAIHATSDIFTAMASKTDENSDPRLLQIASEPSTQIVSWFSDPEFSLRLSPVRAAQGVPPLRDKQFMSLTSDVGVYRELVCSAIFINGRMSSVCPSICYTMSFVSKCLNDERAQAQCCKQPGYCTRHPAVRVLRFDYEIQSVEK
jgi:hypothetical protein